ncbi:MAG: sulfurtransferase [Gammaproteobacteria bacterium]
MQIQNIAGYKFISLGELTQLGPLIQAKCDELALKGTILLSPEGINLSLAGTHKSIDLFKDFLQQDERFRDITFRESFSSSIPFERMKVKIKKEIITMRREEVCPEHERAPSLSPTEFKQWLDEGRDITILDTRNDYEVRFGTFKKAVNLHIDDFCEFPQKAEESVSRDKPVVMFCTGGIRCEKAAIHLQNAGFPEVYQLQGGILNYFAEVGGAYYDGECFVFDQRVALDANLQTAGTRQCTQCQGPVKQDSCQCMNSYSR